MEQKNKEKIEILYQILGTTITVWLFFLYPKSMMWILPIIIGAFVLVIRSVVK